MRFLLIVLGVLLTAGPASAGWQIGESGPWTFIVPEDRGIPAPMLSCSDSGRKAVFIHTENADFAAALSRSKETRDLDMRRIRLFIDGDVVYNEPILFLPMWKMVQSNENALFRTIYNAAVRGDDMEFFLSARGRSDLDVPPVDDVFREFAAICAAAARVGRVSFAPSGVIIGLPSSSTLYPPSAPEASACL